jgi:hypothetical protein
MSNDEITTVRAAAQKMRDEADASERSGKEMYRRSTELRAAAQVLDRLFPAAPPSARVPPAVS